jgi:sugar lactone lactonase YvrE
MTMKRNPAFALAIVSLALTAGLACADDWWKPYTAPCTERENLFAFTEKPRMKLIQKDKYEITFAVKGNCDVTVAMVDEKGVVVRHVASGVLGSNAPPPFRKSSLKQKIFWNGKDDLGYYVKEPEKLKARVSLGLKPEFDRFLGTTHPKNLPGFVWGITADEDGVYVVVKGVGRGHYTVRKFGHRAQYVKTVYPPPAGLSEDKLGGMGFVEYEPGKKTLHAPVINSGTWRESMWMPPGFEGGYGVFGGRPAAAGGRIYFASSGFRHGLASKKQYPVYIHYLKTDGTTEYDGLAGWRWMESDRISQYTQVAASPDGSRIYMVGFQTGRGRGKDAGQPVVLSSSTKPGEKAKVFLGTIGKVGSSNDDLGNPWDVACGPKGNVYVTDNTNNRLQILSPDGKVLKSVKLDRPRLVQVHHKTGAIYVVHAARQRGQSITRVSKLKALPDCEKEIHWDIGNIDVMGLDSWSEKPRLWLSAGKFSWGAISLAEGLSGFRGMCVLEEDGVKLTKLSAFDEDARKAAGENYNGRWGGSGLFNDLVCDPVREKLHYKQKQIFDLKTGKLLGWFAGRKPANVTTGAMGGGHGIGVRGASLAELAFDKRGYMHGFLESGFILGTGGVCRMDPDRVGGKEKHDGGFYAEVPYNYGEVREARWGNTWEGIIPLTNTNSDPFSWGLGVNMRGDIAVAIQSWFVPKMEEESWREAAMGRLKRKEAGMWVSGNVGTYQEWIKNIREMEKHGLEMYHIRRQPGVPLSGGTVWTFDSHGEVRERPAVVAGSRNNGIQIDEDGKLYFTASQFRLVNGKPFMFQRGGNYGGEPLHPRNRTPFFGTYIKTHEKKAFFLRKKSKIQADQLPDRPAELAWPVAGSGGAYHGEPTHAWAEGAEWLYAGSSPIVADHCDCPQMRVWLDWFKRSFVPEAYRHSLGILDTNGNLIMHVGEYGNFDSGNTLDTTMFRFVSGTDNYMAIADWGHRIIVARLNYHAEETIGVRP